MPKRNERRRRRSNDVLKALSLQLEASRDAARFEAMVVADDAGLCVAYAGSKDTCEEVAATLPWLGRKTDVFEGILLEPAQKAGQCLSLRRFHIDDTELYVGAIGGDTRKAAGAIQRSAQGARRILAA